MHNLLSVLTPPNRLAIITSLVTGLRIGDVLGLRTVDINKSVMTVTEQKTLKRRRIRLPDKLREELIAHAGKLWVWEHRLDAKRHRTRQAVYKDVKRAAKAYRIHKLNIACHSARKIYAVAEYRQYLDVRKVQQLLNHDNEAVTLLYCLADTIAAKKLQRQ